MQAVPHSLERPSEQDAFAALFETCGEALVVLSREGTVRQLNRRARGLLHIHEATEKAGQLESLFRSPLLSEALLRPQKGSSSGSIAQWDTVLPAGLPLRVTLRTILQGRNELLLCLDEAPIAERTEKLWKQSQAEMKTLLDSVEAGVLLLDSKGGLGAVNARFTQLLSLHPRVAAPLRRFEDLVKMLRGRFSNPEAFSAPWKAFQEGHGTPFQGEIEILRPVRRVLKRTARPVLGIEGRPEGWLEIYTDVTGEKQIQSKLVQTEKMAALGHLVSGIAHELNNPLTGIMGYAQLLLGQNLPAAQHAEAAKVCEEAERARHIVKNLLCFARETKPEQTRVDLNEIVERTLALRSYELKVENIVVERDLAHDLPETLADAHQLQQVVLNLLVNAEQALLESRGKGRIVLKTRRAAPRRIALEVTDDGPGIPAEIISRVFDPFFTTKAPGVGTGLGLSIVYGIVQQHGGEVTAENMPDGGARFNVEIPILPVPASARAPLQPGFHEPVPRAASGRVLVVEDEPTVAQLVTDALQEEGHSVEAVLDSQEGLTLLSRRRFDLVICDLRMPRVDGPAFYDALVRSGSALQRSILFITGDTLAARTQEFLEGRRLPYLAKPFLLEELKLAVNQLLEAKGRTEAGGPISSSGNLLSEPAPR